MAKESFWPGALALCLGVLAMVFLIGFVVLAWKEPSQVPPGDNVPAPINVSDIAQRKIGDLTVAQITSFRKDDCNAGVLNLIDSANYTNWHFTNRRTGCGGNNDFALWYYTGDNPGAGQTANTWYGPYLWIDKTTGNVGIGTREPTTKLEVDGRAKIGNEGDYLNLYETELLVQRGNIHILGNEQSTGKTSGVYNRLRVGNAWGYGGVYAETDSDGSTQDLVLGASSNSVRIGPDGGGQNLYVSGNVGVGTTNPSSLLDITRNNISVFQNETYGFSLVNTTLASAITPQQISPPIRWRGQGWKTDNPAGSQSVEFMEYVVPTQGTSAPWGALLFASSIDGNSYLPRMALSTEGNIYPGNQTLGYLTADTSGNLALMGGNVGIGTTTTGTYRLNVAGDANATRLCINGACKDSWPPGDPLIGVPSTPRGAGWVQYSEDGACSWPNRISMYVVHNPANFYLNFILDGWADKDADTVFQWKAMVNGFKVTDQTDGKKGISVKLENVNVPASARDYYIRVDVCYYNAGDGAKAEGNIAEVFEAGYARFPDRIRP